MKNFQLVLVCFMCVVNCYGQKATSTSSKVDVEITKINRKKIYTKVEILSAFLGGDSAWIKSMETNLNQSTQLGKGAKKGKYLVSVQFFVNKDGNITDLQALTSNGYGMEAEVLRAIKKKIKWLPSTGVQVRPYRTSSSTPPVSN